MNSRDKRIAIANSIRELATMNVQEQAQNILDHIEVIKRVAKGEPLEWSSVHGKWYPHDETSPVSYCLKYRIKPVEYKPFDMQSAINYGLEGRKITRVSDGLVLTIEAFYTKGIITFSESRIMYKVAYINLPLYYIFSNTNKPVGIEC